MTGLVLSLFPGLGVLDMGFEAEGWCVVRGPDVIWGGDIRNFDPPQRFDGVVGGPPCQTFSPLANLIRSKGGEPRYGNLIPEFCRCVDRCQPSWWLMENVTQAPEPRVAGYTVVHRVLNNHHLGQLQTRVRRFSFGALDPEVPRRFHIETPALVPIESTPAVTAAHEGGRPIGGKKKREGLHGRNVVYPLPEMLELQGLPADLFKDSPLRMDGKKKLVANAVSRPMADAVARAVTEALQPTQGETHETV